MIVTPLPVVSLSPHADNPRGPIKAADVAELAASIAANGLICPLVVQPAKTEGRFTVLAGHRRLMALKSLGRDTADCVVLDPAEADAFGVMLADNIHRVDLDPIRASVLVADLFERDKDATVESVAKRLGKSVPWVARSRAIAALSPAWRKRREAADDPVSSWGFGALAMIAALAPDAQERIAKSARWLETEEQVERVVAEETRVLGTAPWDLDDASLVKRAGRCTTCPKTSISQPGLFEDTPAGEIKHAVCRDGACFLGKLAAFRAREVTAATKDNPRTIVLRAAPDDHGGGVDFEGDRAVAQALQEKGVKVADAYGLSVSKASDPKAVPAYVLGGKGAGKIVHVVPRRAEKQKRATGDERPKGPTAEQKRGVQRSRFVFEACAEAMRSLPVPAPGVVLGLVLAYGLDPAWGLTRKIGELRNRYAFGDDAKRFAVAAWLDLRPALAARFPTEGTGVIERDQAEALWLGEILGLPLEEYAERALREYPEPAGRETKAKPKPKAASKPKAKSRAKATAK